MSTYYLVGDHKIPKSHMIYAPLNTLIQCHNEIGPFYAGMLLVLWWLDQEDKDPSELEKSLKVYSSMIEYVDRL